MDESVAEPIENYLESGNGIDAENHNNRCSHSHSFPDCNQNGDSERNPDQEIGNENGAVEDGGQEDQELYFTEDEQELERRHFQMVLSAFRYYKTFSLKKIARQNAHYNGLNKEQRDRLPDFPSHIASLRHVVGINDQFIQDILNNLPFDEPADSNDVGLNGGFRKNSFAKARPVGSFHMDKVKTTLRMFLRDWSKEGELERSQAYQPLIDAVVKYIPLAENEERQILNPGAGLGRLSWELSKLGYASYGNEFSLYMLFASNFILNRCNEKEMYKIYPWVNHSSNNLSSFDQIAGISIPDVNPASDLPEGHKFGMVAGDFMEIFERNASWDGIVTCFFIDTARNILDYVEHIWHLLKPGAFWFNLGPLLYHFADMANECCIELSYDQLKTVIERTGFKFIEELHDVPCNYVQNPNSMLRYEYRCTFFVCQKPFLVSDEQSDARMTEAEEK